ncbi:glycogen synthase [Balneolales bacterium ANBcel1]|nr:glycogen synthase [Balneolales bacterium ANBcel1]
MQVIQVSFECYPVAKAGGLGDVVGALPKYLQQFDVDSWVVMPHFDIPWVRNHQLKQVHDGITRMGDERFHYRIMREEGGILGFPLFLVDIPGKLDRPGIYIDPNSDFPYWDEYERFLSFQIATLDWMKSFSKKPDIIHCHDHHTALIPFLMTSSPVFHEFASIPSILTIHNGHYQGWYDSGKSSLLPTIDPQREGYLYWNGQMNALSAGVRTAWQITTVSQSYLEELQLSSKGLESLLANERGKSRGIINGIDSDIWNPATDPLIIENYDAKNVLQGKKKNKEWLCHQFELDADLPLFVFIGRLVDEKGADLLPDLIIRFLETGLKASFLILGTGDPFLHTRFEELKNRYPGFCDVSLTYNEELAHRMYAGSDFLLMPSRVEPCGLNQMYALRYGSIPVVRSIGGLKDSVIDFSEPDGYGILFENFNLDDSFEALKRAMTVHADEGLKSKLQNRALSKDFSWHNSAQQYHEMYQSLITE